VRGLIDEQLSESLLPHNRDVASLLRERWPRIEEFVNDRVIALLELA
jgi:hypothetical protein